jgi:hypothetical protein
LSRRRRRRKESCSTATPRTVRIGKWRWPPPKEEIGEAAAGDPSAEGFFEFKMRKLQQKMSQSKDGSNNQGRDDDLEASGEIQSNFGLKTEKEINKDREGDDAIDREKKCCVKKEKEIE